MRLVRLASILLSGAALLRPQTHQAPSSTPEAILERYQQAIGGVDAIRKVRSETRHGEFESSTLKVKGSIISYAKPFKFLQKITLPDGRSETSGFDGTVKWSVGPNGAARIDRDTPAESLRRDGDLQYALHERDYFKNYEFAGITDFEGHRCYWIHGTTNWGKDNNQFYDVETGLVIGYRFQSDSSKSAVVTTTKFEDYKSFGGPLVATRIINRTGERTQTVTFTSISYKPIDDALFELPEAVKALVK